MKKIKMKYTEVIITARNQREERLARIFNGELERVHEYVGGADSISESLKEKREDHWLIEDLGGIASAMYFLDMTEECVTPYDIWKAINEK